MKTLGVGVLAAALAAGAGWALEASAPESAPQGSPSVHSVHDVRAFLSEFAPGFSARNGGELPRTPEAAFDIALTRLSGHGVEFRMNAALLAARAEWTLLSASEKEALHPFFHPPVEGLGSFADAPNEIRFPRGFGASRVAEAAVALDAARAAVAGHLPSLARHAETAPVRAALVAFPPGAGLAGYAALSGGEALAVVDSELVPERMREEIFYQGAFALLLGAAPHAEAWLVEATAIWLAHEAGFENYVSRVEPPTDATFAAGVGARPLGVPADPSFLFYLDSGLKNAALIDALWSAAAKGGSFRAALPPVLAEHGFSLDDVLPQFSLWTLHRGARSSREVFSEGARWPEFTPAARAEGAPFAFSGDGPAPWGFAAVAVNSVEAARLSFEGRGGRFAAQTLLGGAACSHASRDAEDGDWISLNVRDGEGALSLPGGAAADAVVTMALLDSRDAAPSWRLRAETLGDYPARVGSARAEERDGGVRVSWTALAEENVAGWRVWRVQPNGHHVLLTPIPVPSPGDSREPMHYAWFDLVPRYHAGAYRYFVEALTRDGLTARYEAGSVSVAAPRGRP